MNPIENRTDPNLHDKEQADWPFAEARLPQHTSPLAAHRAPLDYVVTVWREPCVLTLLGWPSERLSEFWYHFVQNFLGKDEFGLIAVRPSDF